MIAQLAVALERETPVPAQGFSGWLDATLPWLHTMKGPHFLILFGIWFIVLRIFVANARTATSDAPFATVAALLLFEGLGALRWFAGSAHGMANWDGLRSMMIFGAMFLVLRLDHGSGSGGGGSSCSSSCSSASSCSSGCGGGGGCGGCGGS